jgi:hypothetical protein
MSQTNKKVPVNTSVPSVPISFQKGAYDIIPDFINAYAVVISKEKTSIFHQSFPDLFFYY